MADSDSRLPETDPGFELPSRNVRILSPADVKALPEEALPELASALRKSMITSVSETGGHIAPSLGTVELTIALCRTFDFPADKVLWDVGHQSYAWKMLTGRAGRMPTLRRYGGLRGFTDPRESPYDTSVAGHAGVALSTALGMAAARDARGETNAIIAVVGDASLTNGISLEALNAVRHTTEKLILVINDNGMSISRNVGALARVFARRLTGLRYNRLRAAADAAGHRLHLTGLRDFYRRIKIALKPLLLRNRAGIFEDLGLRYIGPIDGHDIPALCDALRTAAEGTVPIAIHIATVKGKGYPPAERNPSKWHGVGPWANKTAAPAAPVPAWSEIFGTTLTRLAETDSRITAVTAAMRDGTGLAGFFRKFPKRAYDVGICEEHALVFSAGLAANGLRPVAAIYSTFSQRAIDCVMHDICLPGLPVILGLDRAGAVGADGPTHHGLYDIAMLRALPGLQISAPCIASDLAPLLIQALREGTPAVIRYPRGAAPTTLPEGTLEAPPPGTGPIILALGPTVFWIAEAARALHLPLVAVRNIKPLPPWVATLGNRPVITLEDAAAAGGFGSAIAEQTTGPRLILGWPDRFVPQGTDAELRRDAGLDTEGLHKRLTAFTETL